MSDDIYKILESMDRVKSGHKDQLKGTDKPSKGKTKYDGPYTKHPFQGKLVGEDATEEEEDLFHTELDDLVHKTFGSSSDEKKKMEEGRMKELSSDLEDLSDEAFKDKYGADKSTFSFMVAKGNIDNYDIRKKPWKDSDVGAVRGSKENLVSDIHEEFEKFDNSQMMTEEQFDEAAGQKDACYHKVKSRYKVWPSAYASGALSKCRKVGAKNWGNKSKKKSNENVEMDSKLDVNKLLTSLRNTKKTPNSDRLADAIEMRFMHNMTFKEIGEELNVAPQTAAIIVSKALRLLRWHAARNPN